MAKKPKVYENEINKNIRNNKIVFDSSKEKVENEITMERKEDVKLYNKNNDDLSVIDKITRLLNREGYIFNVNVSIITKDEVLNTHIASIMNNHIITLDNDIINIDDIIDIKY